MAERLAGVPRRRPLTTAHLRNSPPPFSQANVPSCQSYQALSTLRGRLLMLRGTVPSPRTAALRSLHSARSSPAVIGYGTHARRHAPVAAAAMPPTTQSAPAAPVVVFTTPGCPYCKRAKEALRGRGVAFAEVDVGADAGLRAALAEATGQRTVPQVRARPCEAHWPHPHSGAPMLLPLTASDGPHTPANAPPPDLCQGRLHWRQRRPAGRHRQRQLRRGAGARGGGGPP